ncbi:hypothetical protein FRC0195_00179 [Corynebacterium diphtheriae]|nr:hypothetical protein FRC0195_00179 [Corynebacterium diphtheriae]
MHIRGEILSFFYRLSEGLSTLTHQQRDRLTSHARRPNKQQNTRARRDIRREFAGLIDDDAHRLVHDKTRGARACRGWA